MFGGMGADRDALYDLAVLEGGKPEDVAAVRGEIPDDTPTGRWMPIIASHPVKGPQLNGYRHPASESAVIWRKGYLGGINGRTADDKGWSLFHYPHIREIADGTLAELCDLGDSVVLDG